MMEFNSIDWADSNIEKIEIDVDFRRTKQAPLRLNIVYKLYQKLREKSRNFWYNHLESIL